MGKPRNAFDAVRTNEGWQVINKGDWIVKAQEQLLVIPNGVFKLFFEEVK